MGYHDQMFFDGATPAGTLSFTDDTLEIDFQPSPKAQALGRTRRSRGLTALLSIAIAILAGSFITDAAHAGWGGHHHNPRLTVPVAYDQFWKLKNPGGPVELNPQPLPPGVAFNPADKVTLNPQPLLPKYLGGAAVLE